VDDHDCSHCVKRTVLDWQQQYEELVDAYLTNQLNDQQPISRDLEEQADGQVSIEVIDLYGASPLVRIC